MLAAVTDRRISQLDQYEWMLLHGEELARAIATDGGFFGPEADGMLTEVQKLECGGRIRQQARELLKMRLCQIGAGHLFYL